MGQTPTYHPFPESDAEWNFHYAWNCWEFGMADIDYSFITAGDTTIQDVNYIKLHTPDPDDNSIGDCGGITVGYRGALRQDIENKLVYFVPPNETEEQLLYDFNLEVGDTLSGYIAPAWDEICQVESIDSVLVGNSYRKRWNVNWWYYDAQLIEGIGSTYGLLERLTSVTDLPDYTLSCFTQAEEVLYPPNSEPCQVITNVHQVAASKNYRVYPNPSTGSFHIDGPTLSDIDRVRIYNSIGMVVSDRQDIDLGTSRFKLPETAGLYHIEINLVDGTTTYLKVIKD